MGLGQVRFKINPKDWEDEEIREYYARRVAMLVQGEDIIYRQDTGYVWTLGSSNDWFLDIDESTQEFVLAHRRYFEQEKWDQLRVVLIWLLHLEPYNRAK
jgi:hypothetical protein